MLDDQLVTGASCRLNRPGDELIEDFGAVEKDVEIAGAGNLDSRYARLGFEDFSQLSGDLAWICLMSGGRLDAFRQLKGDRKGKITKLDARRDLRRDVVQRDVKL
jgi:hypothetical protein